MVSGAFFGYNVYTYATASGRAARIAPWSAAWGVTKEARDSIEKAVEDALILVEINLAKLITEKNLRDPRDIGRCSTALATLRAQVWLDANQSECLEKVYNAAARSLKRHPFPQYVDPYSVLRDKMKILYCRCLTPMSIALR